MEKNGLLWCLFEDLAKNTAVYNRPRAGTQVPDAHFMVIALTAFFTCIGVSAILKQVRKQEAIV